VRSRIRAGAAALAALVAIGGAGTAAGATIAVTENSDALHASGCAATGSPPCSLRDAITFANARPGADIIAFAIGTGPATIRLASPLPAITGPVVVDGAKQPGWAGFPLVEIDGSAAGDEAAGLRITAGASTVRGLALNRFRSASLAAIVLAEKGGNLLQGNFVGTDPSGSSARANRGTGILVRCDRNTIGGTVPAARNVISGNTGTGIRVQGSGNLMLGNLVGTDASGQRALGNGGDGAAVSGGNTIGGAAPGARNLISGNGGFGISAGPSETILGNFIGTDAGGAVRVGNAKGGIAGGGRIGGTEGTRPAGPCSGACNLISGNGGPGVAPAAGSTVAGNFIGTDAAGAAALPNGGAGVFVNGVARVTIGDASESARNLISGNDGPGVEIAFDAEAANLLGNVIGADATGDSPLGNAEGVRLRDRARKNRIGTGATSEGNLIAFNAGPGVVAEVSAGDGNAILGNSIHSNGALGIDLGRDGVTPNHAAQPNAGPNALQNFPVLETVTPFSVEGTLDSTPQRTFTLEIFASSACDPSGYGQGQSRIAVTTLTTDAAGHAEFGVSLTAPPGEWVAVTATDASGNTSEFSPCILVGTEEETGGAFVP
jgi:hypothetical protein